MANLRSGTWRPKPPKPKNTCSLFMCLKIDLCLTIDINDTSKPDKLSFTIKVYYYYYYMVR